MMFILKIYLYAVIASLILEALVVLKSQLKGLGIMEYQLLVTLVVSFLPIINVLIMYNDIMILLYRHDEFIAEIKRIRKGTLE